MSKRYSRKDAESLLLRIVKDCGDGAKAATAQIQPKLPVRARETLSALLRAPFGDVVVRNTSLTGIREATDGTIIIWLRRLARVLHDNVPTADGLITIGRFHVPQSGDLVLPHIELLAVRHRREYQFEIDAVDKFGLIWLQALRLLQFVGPQRLQHCECGQMFVRSGKRKFCSAACQKRFYMRRWRAGEAGKD